jgi:hypothetical protein
LVVHKSRPPVPAPLSLFAGEELPLGSVHASLKKEWPRLLTILAPRQASRAPEVAAALTADLGLRAALWSSGGLGAAAGAAAGSGGSGSSGSGGGRSCGGGGGGGSGGGACGRTGPIVPPPLEGVDILVLDVPADLPLMYWWVRADTEQGLSPGAARAPGRGLKRDWCLQACSRCTRSALLRPPGSCKASRPNTSAPAASPHLPQCL